MSDRWYRLLPIPLLMLGSPVTSAHPTALATLELPVCGDADIALRLPLKRDPVERGGPDCPMACHIAGSRRRMSGDCGSHDIPEMD